MDRKKWTEFTDSLFFFTMSDWFFFILSHHQSFFFVCYVHKYESVCKLEQNAHQKDDKKSILITNKTSNNLELELN